MKLSNLKHLALDLVSPNRPVSTEVLASLAEEDWKRVGSMLRQHRLEPLLYWRLSRERSEPGVPGKFLQQLKQCFQATTLRALSLQRELLFVHRILTQAQVPHIMLKGAFLAFHAYPHPALRPMRDIDILVPRDKALLAYQALVDGGMQRDAAFVGDAAAALDILHHLPALHSADGNMHLEVHTQLFHGHQETNPFPDLSEDDEFWQRTVVHPIANAAISFESPTDLLFHLIIHAVYDHKFNNGPLLISDLAYLLESEKIDWDLFWRLAQERGQERGCLLALLLTERYCGKQDIRWPAEIPPDADTVPIEEAALLMLQEIKYRKALLLSSKLSLKQSRWQRTHFVLQKVFPSRQEISSVYPVSTRSWRIYLGYPVKWWRMLRSKVPNCLGSLMQQDFYMEAKTMRAIDQWLR